VATDVDVLRLIAMFALNVVEDGLDLLLHHHREAVFRKFLAEHPGVTVYRVEDIQADTHVRNPYPFD
jgi:hypothetical protein